MKQKIPLPKKLLLIAVILPLLVWLFNSCRKDQNARQITPSENTVSAMQAEFTKLGYNASLLMPLNDTSRIKWIPHWDLALHQKKDSLTYTYVPLSIAMQVIKTGKLYSQTINARLAKYILVESFKNRNNYFLATYLNTDTLNHNFNFDSFTGASYLQSMDGTARYLVNYKNGKTLNISLAQSGAIKRDKNARNLSQVLQCWETYDCTFGAYCSGAGVPEVTITETLGYGSCAVPLQSVIGCQMGTPSGWTVTQIKTGEVCVWVDSNDPNAPPPPLPPCQTCTPPPPSPPTPPPPGDPCDSYKASGAQKANTMVSGNSSIASAINQTIANSKNGSESAFHIDNVNGSFVASTPVLTTSEGAPFSSTNIDNNTFAIGHDHDASSFPQPSPYDIYSLGELAVTTNGRITMDYTTSASSKYVLVVTNISAFKTFLSNFPESNLTPDGDLDRNQPLGSDVFSVGQDAYNIDPLKGTTQDAQADINANEISTVYLLDHYNTGITLLKLNASGVYQALHNNSTQANGQTIYSVSPCN